MSRRDICYMGGDQGGRLPLGGALAMLWYRNEENCRGEMMSFNLEDCLVIGISSRALFDLEEENALFEEEGIDAYRAYQRQHEDLVLGRGTAYYMIEELLKINDLVDDRRLVEVVVMSKNSPDTGLRVFASIDHYGLDISRAAFAGGEDLHEYLDAFSVDLFLSKSEEDVQGAVDHGVASAILYEPPDGYAPVAGQIRIAFDGDAVLFSEESEKVYKEQGLEAFVEHENLNRDNPLPDGPFAKLLCILAYLQQTLPREDNPFRLALVTARKSPSHVRVVNTLRDWGVNLDEAFFLGGMTKSKVLQSFRAHIFFDDQDVHVGPASRVVPSARVPYKTGSSLKSLPEG
ncbi:related to 5'-nucleotidase [Desulfotalea psychrophila LSv54]|uniref:Related to 5'-nucleotidase n=2 Tax=Desulfotalea psychrophila TaxID=84980 RepID=Q6ANJ1_DESPS|nr:related to 5'-nucleotidase [Desulfotalea psychrophila LSv54]